MTFIIKAPNNRLPERRYIFDIVFNEFLGLDYFLELTNDEEHVRIYLKEDLLSKCVTLPDILFDVPSTHWLGIDSLPKQPLKLWNSKVDQLDSYVVSKKIPLIYACNDDRILNVSEDNIQLGIDIFGSAFFMLTRYEEYVKPDRDQHDRFPAKASLAYQEDFLDRPIINEYIEILWWCMKRLWPRLQRKKRIFRTIVSHDVDVPFAQAFTGVSHLIRNCGGDVLKRKSVGMAFKRIKSWQDVKKGNYKKDFNYTFDYIMDISEKNNIKSAFYFKTACTNTTYDNKYSMDHPYLRQLIRDIYNRGHEIGLHPSYETYQNSEQTKAEFDKLLQVCNEEGIHQDQWGGRQHFLRWKVPDTWRNWVDAGLDYDSTLSFADHAGFRCGICYEFQVYDLELRKPLPLIERPLIVMEGSVLGEKYMGLSGEEALDHMLKLKTRCQWFDGDFTLLWHNNSFDTLQMWNMYAAVI